MLSPSRVAVFAALAGGLMATLQGCGGAGTTTPAPPPPPTPPPAWKWTEGHPKCMFDDATGKKCTQVSTKELLAASFTKSFTDFDPKNPDGKELGVYMTMQTDNLRLYCGSSGASDGGKCFHGHSDCILSVGLYNSHMMLDGDQEGAHLNTFAHKTAGYIINPKKMETRYAKCAYFFDGASNGKKYWGCGDSGTSDCGDGSAFANQCKDPANPGKTRTCQADDVEVRPRNDCTQVLSPTNPFKRLDGFPTLTSQVPCYYTGPAFRYPDYSKATEENLLKEMVITRVKNENPSPGDCSDVKDQCKDPKTGQYWRPIGPNGFCCKPWKDGKPQSGCEPGENLIHQTDCNRMKKWNEVVVDLRPFLEDLENDPNDVISAFVYADASGKVVAEKLRKEFKDKFGGPGDVPLVFLDLGQNIMPNLKKFGTPFKADMPSHAIETDEQVSV